MLIVFIRNVSFYLFVNSELMEQSVSLEEKSLELKTNLEQIYDELRSRIGDVSEFHCIHTLSEDRTLSRL